MNLLNILVFDILNVRISKLYVFLSIDDNKGNLIISGFVEGPLLRLIYESVINEQIILLDIVTFRNNISGCVCLCVRACVCACMRVASKYKLVHCSIQRWLVV